MADGHGTTQDELPIPDYDHLPVGSLAHRIRSLDSAALTVLLEDERTHGNRLPVLQVMEVRLRELAEGAQPSAGDPAAPAPELAGPPTGGSPVSPQTQGPVQNPPSHGDPTNPAQPR
jgi:hypothetical protein